MGDYKVLCILCICVLYPILIVSYKLETTLSTSLQHAKTRYRKWISQTYYGFYKTRIISLDVL